MTMDVFLMVLFNSIANIEGSQCQLTAIICRDTSKATDKSITTREQPHAAETEIMTRNSLQMLFDRLQNWQSSWNRVGR